MKTKTLYIIVGLFALCSAALGAVQEAAEGAFSSVIAFPFQQIALGLRVLSLSGSGGNIAAIAIYVLLCLLPSLVALFWYRKKLYGEDILIPIFSATMFAAIYFMINPSLLTGSYGEEFFPILRLILGGACWCVVISWTVLKLIRRSREADREGVQALLKICLGLMAFFFVAVAFAGAVGDFAASYEELREGNTAGYLNLSLTTVFLAVKAIISALPYALDAIVAVKGMELLTAMAADPYSAGTVEKGEGLASFAVMSLKVTIVLSLIFNLLQLVFIKKLLVVDMELVLPLVSIAFMLCALLLSRLIRENKALKDDNDMFI